MEKKNDNNKNNKQTKQQSLCVVVSVCVQATLQNMSLFIC